MTLFLCQSFPSRISSSWKFSVEKFVVGEGFRREFRRDSSSSSRNSSRFVVVEKFVKFRRDMSSTFLVKDFFVVAILSNLLLKMLDNVFTYSALMLCNINILVFTFMSVFFIILSR